MLEGTRYYAPAFNSDLSYANAFEERAVLAPTAFSLTDLFCAYQGDWTNDFGEPGASASFTVMKNGSETSLSASITGTTEADRNCTPFPSSASVSFQEGDLIALRVVSSNASTAPPGLFKWSMKLIPETAGERVLMTTYEQRDSATKYASLASESSYVLFTSTELGARVLFPMPGTFTRAVCQSSVGFSGADVRDLDLLFNGSVLPGNPLRCTLNATNATDANAVTGTLPVDIGDGVTLRDSVGGGAPGGGYLRVSFVFRPTDPSLWPIFGSTDTSVTELRYMGPGYQLVNVAPYNATTFQHHPGVRFRALHVAFQNAPGAGGHWTPGLRYHETTGTDVFEVASCEIAGSNTACSLTGDFNSEVDRWYDVRLVPQDSPAATGAIRWGIAASADGGDPFPSAVPLVPY